MRLSSRFSLLFGLLAAGIAVLLMVFWDALLDRASKDRAIRRLQAEDTLVAALAEPVFHDPSTLDLLVRSSAARLRARVTPDVAPLVRTARVELHEKDVFAPGAHQRAAAEVHRTGPDGHRIIAPSLRHPRSEFRLSGRTRGGGRPNVRLRGSPFPDDLRAEESETVWWGARRSSRPASSCSSWATSPPGAWRCCSRSRRPRRRCARRSQARSAGRGRSRGGGARRGAPDEEHAARLLAAAESEQRLTATVFDRLPPASSPDARGRCCRPTPPFPHARRGRSGGRPLVDILREPEVIALFDAAIDAGREQSMIWKRAGEVTWEVNVLPLPAGARGRAVGIFRDVTPIARTEAMRRRFVADVSHELRTPISSIAAAAETLLEGSPDREDATAHRPDRPPGQPDARSDRPDGSSRRWRDRARLGAGGVPSPSARWPRTFPAPSPGGSRSPSRETLRWPSAEIGDGSSRSRTTCWTTRVLSGRSVSRRR